MGTLVNLAEYRRRKEQGKAQAQMRPTVEDSTERIRDSLTRVNNLMAELKAKADEQRRVDNENIKKWWGLKDTDKR